MIMSSYLMDSTYIDPKFPPCEEYSQNSYIPDHSPEYYSRARDPGSGFQHHHQELYPPRASYQERQYNCASIPEPDTQRGHGLPHTAHLLAGKGQPASCETPQLPMSPTTPPAASSACNQATPEHPNSSASSKQPVVYPWMKKIHISTGRQLVSVFVFSLSPLSTPLSPPFPPFISASNSHLLPSPCYDRGEAFEMAQLRRIYDSASRTRITMERIPSGLGQPTLDSRS
ncbi:homeobox protein HoxC4aa isoform X1 [Salmo salar]|uniref:Homeobox protein HoxC4aa isoform X1 n=1 Tax=Salmo salar TaxID=8030 RepID=A0A1S3LKH7_SALSA|nr:homeobox protein HoxC4aa isoform X1 [Salmo salar]|eukprot:XP_013991014.1 PREDICTED: homeobox protein HoxC4aa isoform X1 [Salmo salar]